MAFRTDPSINRAVTKLVLATPRAQFRPLVPYIPRVAAATVFWIVEALLTWAYLRRGTAVPNKGGHRSHVRSVAK